MTIEYENTPELQAVLQHQQQVAGALANVQRLEQAIADQQQKADALNECASELKALEIQREDLLADIATGLDKSDVLKTLEDELAKRKQELHEQGTQAAIEQTVAGLRRKLDKANAEHANLASKAGGLMRSMLTAQAESLGGEYVIAARHLKAVFRRLTAVRLLLDSQGAAVHHWTRNPLNIPMFPLESMLSEPMKQLDKEQGWLFRSEVNGAEFAPILNQEKAAIERAGVHLDSAD